MRADEITDQESLTAWLQERPREDAIRIANRCAQRVFPLWAGAMSEDWARNLDLTALLVLRQNLTSGVAAVSATPEVKNAADRAYTAFPPPTPSPSPPTPTSKPTPPPPIPPTPPPTLESKTPPPPPLRARPPPSTANKYGTKCPVMQG